MRREAPRSPPPSAAEALARTRGRRPFRHAPRCLQRAPISELAQIAKNNSTQGPNKAAAEAGLWPIDPSLFPGAVDAQAVELLVSLIPASQLR